MIETVVTVVYALMTMGWLVFAFWYFWVNPTAMNSTAVSFTEDCKPTDFG